MSVTLTFGHRGNKFGEADAKHCLPEPMTKIFSKKGFDMKNEIEFFLCMIPPTVTQQEHKVRVVNGKPVFYEPPELRSARQLFMDSLIKHVPENPLDGPLQLITKWIWPIEDISGQQRLEECWQWKTTKPDTDNLIKMLKDCMTRTHFWKDDAQVASEITEKFLSGKPGIYVKVVKL